MALKSTNGRTLPLNLAVARAGLLALSRLAPGKAAKVTTRMFCRPGRHPRPPHEEAVLGDAHAFQVRVSRRPIQAWRWTPTSRDAGRTVFLVHGWAGRGTQLAALVRPLLARGYTVVTWDGPGHGASPGDSSSLVELADTVFAVARTLRVSPYGIIAHSMGSGASCLAIAEGLPCQRAVWIAPPASLLDYIEQFTVVMGFNDLMQKRVTDTMNRSFAVNLRDYDVESMGVPHGERMLVIHDLHDKEVPFEQGQRVAAAIGAAELVTTERLGHRRILRSDEVVQRAVDWIAAAGFE